MCSLSVQMIPKVYNSLWKQRKDKKKKMIKDKRTKRWNKQKGKRTSGVWDLSEKRREEKAEVGKMEFWEKTKNLKPTFDFWPVCQSIESQRV